MILYYKANIYSCDYNSLCKNTSTLELLHYLSISNFRVSHFSKKNKFMKR